MIEQLLTLQNPNTGFVQPPILDNSIFKGYVKPSALIDGDALASLVNLTSGVSFNSDAGWLKFIDNGVEMYIARKPLRFGMTGDALTAASQKNGKVVTIGGSNYLVRMLSCFTVDPYSNINAVTLGGEWVKYIYPIYSDPLRPAAAVWSTYTNGQLGLTTNGVLANGVITLIREWHNTAVNAYGGMGWPYSGADNSIAPVAKKTVINDASPSEGNAGFGKNAYGWRPILIKQ